MAGAFWLKSRGTPGVRIEQLAQQKPSPVPIQSVTPLPAAESKLTTPSNPVEQFAALTPKLETRTTPLESNQPGTEPAASPTAPSEDIKTQPAVATRTELPKTEPAAITPEPVRTQPTPPPTPAFRLQAIYYRMKGPTVVINNKTLKVGDSVDGAKLLSIERTSAEIEFQGARQKLTMH
jgi:hypothetical protein